MFYYITTDFVARYDQIKEGGYAQKWIYWHGFGKLPAFKTGGQFHEMRSGDHIYESRISGMVPYLNEAVHEYSDLQAEIVPHVHSEKYAYVNAECPHCIKISDSEINKCPKCNGTGFINSVLPYSLTLITPNKTTEQQLPTPPLGYIQKQTEIAKLQDLRVRSHKRDALSADNMEFLANSRLGIQRLAVFRR